MRGTGSHDVSVEDVFVPSDMTIDFERWMSPDNPGSALHSETLIRHDARDVFGVQIASYLVGGARAVLQGFRERLAIRRLPFSPSPQIDSSMGRARFGKAAGFLQVAEVLLDHATDVFTEAAASRSRLSDPQRAMVKLELLNCEYNARNAIATVIEGSGSSIYKTSDPTQRFKRDADMILGHFTADSDWVNETAGGVLLGVDEIRNAIHFF
jgi:alkylation response protein AidB-like acyl-CoA dehydrogenase